MDGSVGAAKDAGGLVKSTGALLRSEGMCNCEEKVGMESCACQARRGSRICGGMTRTPEGKGARLGSEILIYDKRFRPGSSPHPRPFSTSAENAERAREKGVFWTAGSGSVEWVGGDKRRMQDGS